MSTNVSSNDFLSSEVKIPYDCDFGSIIFNTNIVEQAIYYDIWSRRISSTYRVFAVLHCVFLAVILVYIALAVWSKRKICFIKGFQIA